MRTFLISLSFLLSSTMAFAMPSQGDVANAVGRNDWARAEILLKDVLQERNSAKAHYQLGQVYAHEFRHAEALAEFKKAKDIDPTLNFASSKNLFNHLFEKEQAIIDGGSSRQEPKRTDQQNGLVAGQVSNKSPGAPSLANTLPRTSQSGGVSAFVIIAFFAIFIIAFGLFFYIKFTGRRQKAKKEESERIENSKRQLAELVELSNQLRDAELECKTAAYSTAQKDQVLEKLSPLRSEILTAIATTKSRHPITDKALTSLRDRSLEAMNAVKSGAWLNDVKYKEEVDIRECFSPYRNNSKSQVVHVDGENSRSPLPFQQTTVVRETSGGGMLTGMLIGSMLSGHSQASETRHTSHSEDSQSINNNFDLGSGTSITSEPSSFSPDTFDSGSDTGW